MKSACLHLYLCLCFQILTGFNYLFNGAEAFSTSSSAAAAGLRLQPTSISISISTSKSQSIKQTRGASRRAQSSTSLNVAAAVPVVATATATAMALPSAKAILATTLLPTCLGYYRYEYGVSYGYGTATALTAFLTLRSLLANPTFTAGSFACMAQLHALAIVFYGVRLNAFLLFREAFIPRFRKMRETIEDRQRVKEVDTGLIGKFINRTPFILSCAVLYAGLASSPLIGAKLIAMGNGCGNGYNPTCKIGLMVYKALVGTTYFGFLLGAIGDLTKTVVKGRKGSDHLVTGGVFSIFRHPNYTGEVIGWVSSFLASLVAVMSVVMTGTGTGTGTAGINKLSMVKEFGPLLALSFAGVLGIAFVLFAAASNLEKRQKEKYGDDEIYAKWIASSWSGPKLKQSKPVGKE